MLFFFNLKRARKTLELLKKKKFSLYIERIYGTEISISTRAEECFLINFMNACIFRNEHSWLCIWLWPNETQFEHLWRKVFSLMREKERVESKNNIYVETRERFFQHFMMLSCWWKKTRQECWRRREKKSRKGMECEKFQGV